MLIGDSLILSQHPGSATMIAFAVIALLAPLPFQGLSRFRQDED
jgi:putative tricarboxylic transport membrane protein